MIAREETGEENVPEICAWHIGTGHACQLMEDESVKSLSGRTE